MSTITAVYTELQLILPVGFPLLKDQRPELVTWRKNIFRVLQQNPQVQMTLHKNKSLVVKMWDRDLSWDQAFDSGSGFRLTMNPSCTLESKSSIGYIRDDGQYHNPNNVLSNLLLLLFPAEITGQQPKAVQDKIALLREAVPQPYSGGNNGLWEQIVDKYRGTSMLIRRVYLDCTNPLTYNSAIREQAA